MTPSNIPDIDACKRADVAAAWEAICRAIGPDALAAAEAAIGKRLDYYTKLTRPEFADVATAAGFRTTPGTLATQASRNGGPPFGNWGLRTLYEFGPSMEWVLARFATPRRRRDASKAESTAAAE